MQLERPRHPGNEWVTEEGAARTASSTFFGKKMMVLSL